MNRSFNEASSCASSQFRSFSGLGISFTWTPIEGGGTRKLYPILSLSIRWVTVGGAEIGSKVSIPEYPNEIRKWPKSRSGSQLWPTSVFRAKRSMIEQSRRSAFGSQGDIPFHR